jgi:hypothetical protein
VTVRAIGTRAGALWLLATAAAALVACLVAATPAGDLVRDSFDAYLHHRPGDPGRAAYIFARNAGVGALFLACAWLVANQPGQRRALDVFVIGACAVFVVRFAVMVGGFGWPVVRYMATYGAAPHRCHPRDLRRRCAVSEPSGLQRLIERACRLRIAGVSERDAHGVVVDASRAEPCIRQRAQCVGPPADAPPAEEERA